MSDKLRPSIKRAVEFLADIDQDTPDDEVGENVSVIAVAYALGIDPDELAQKVVKRRRSL